MTDLAQALRAFAELFEQMGIPYVVMGGLAVRVHGIPRPTHDVDFTLAISRESLRRGCDDPLSPQSAKQTWQSAFSVPMFGNFAVLNAEHVEAETLLALAVARRPRLPHVNDDDIVLGDHS